MVGVAEEDQPENRDRVLGRLQLGVRPEFVGGFPQALFEFSCVGWHELLSAGRRQFLFEFPLVALHEFDEQSARPSLVHRICGSLKSNPAQEFPSFGREIDPGRAVCAFFRLGPAVMGFGFQHDEKTSVLETVANCELWMEPLGKEVGGIPRPGDPSPNFFGDEIPPEQRRGRRNTFFALWDQLEKYCSRATAAVFRSPNLQSGKDAQVFSVIRRHHRFLLLG